MIKRHANTISNLQKMILNPIKPSRFTNDLTISSSYFAIKSNINETPSIKLEKKNFYDNSFKSQLFKHLKVNGFEELKNNKLSQYMICSNSLQKSANPDAKGDLSISSNQINNNSCYTVLTNGSVNKISQSSSMLGEMSEVSNSNHSVSHKPNKSEHISSLPSGKSKSTFVVIKSVHGKSKSKLY